MKLLSQLGSSQGGNGGEVVAVRSKKFYTQLYGIFTKSGCVRVFLRAFNCVLLTHRKYNCLDVDASFFLSIIHPAIIVHL